MGLANKYGLIIRVALISTALCLASCHVRHEEHTSSHLGQLLDKLDKAQRGHAEAYAQTESHTSIEGDAPYAKIEADMMSALHSKSVNKQDEAIHYANSAIAAIKASVDSESIAGLRLLSEMEYIVGTANAAISDLPRASNHLTTGADYAIRGSNPIGIIKLSMLNAKILSRTTDLSGCLAALRLVELTADTANETSTAPATRTTVYSDVASVAIDINDIATANRNLFKANETFDAASDLGKIAYLTQLTRMHLIGGEMSQAATTLKSLQHLIEEADLREMTQDEYVYQGLAWARLHDANKASQFLAKVDTAKLSSQGGMMCYKMLESCVNDLYGDHETAQRILFHDIQEKKETTPFERLIWDDCKIWHYEKTGDYEKANRIQSDRRNIIATLTSNSILTQNNLNRETDIARTALLKARRDTTLQEKGQAQSITAIVVTIIATLTVIAVILFNNRRIRHKKHTDDTSNEIIDRYVDKIAKLERQAEALGRTNDRISESIAYAEHIQHSISPSPEQLNDYPISGSFVFYNPLDVVSGDFFWFKSVGDSLVIVCADCTGHGVPGALLSMISATILNETCNRMDEGSLDPAEILEQLDSSLIQNLRHNSQSTEEVKDGLDISIAVLNLITHDVRLAAARRPIIIFHDGSQTTIRGTRRSIGDTEPAIRSRPFETTHMKLNKNDKIYMYTDGYSDQFGGQNGEKLKNAKIERLLTNICDDDMDQQSLTIQEAFTLWKGDYPQNDDVTFIGVSV